MTADRTPRVFDHVHLYGERMTILNVSDGKVRTHDDADCRIERRIDALEWVPELGAWREISRRPLPWVVAEDMTVTVPLENAGER